ncbi:MAG TPA: ROK family transcriptional regulator [Pyrinomonadaceae bacterium]
MRKIDLNSFNIATSETARNINRRIILDLIRTRQPISRADLARLSGLQRSTISVITEQLMQEQWITQGAFGHLPRGRKPRFLHLNVERVGIIGVNVQPHQTTIALSDINAHFLAHETFSTAAEPQAFVADLAERIRKFIDSNPQISFEGVGVSLPGRVDLKTKNLLFAPNLGWRDVDLKTPLEESTGLPVEVENAANACALAEIWFEKRAEGVRDLIAVTVSEGIGTGIISNGQLIQGINGAAGEFGHISIEQNGLLCKCGNRGCWEMYASNTAAINNYVQATKSSRSTRENTGDVEKPAFEDVLFLAEQGDAKASEALDTMGESLGIGLAMLIAGLAPELIVIIGEITRAWDKIEPALKRVIDLHLPAAQNKTRIVAAEDIMQPRLRGSASLILQKHFGAPVFA